ncbi:MAG: hypothetical protein QGH33_11005 [Pirellulaceae bacterium]|nr:hypothetical protein [Pirellulaceae bacterium]
MNRPSSPSANRWSASGSVYRCCLVMCLIGLSLPAASCKQNQIKSLLNAGNEPEATPQEKAELQAAPVVSPTPPMPARSSAPVSAIDVDPGSGRDVTMVAGFRMRPPETFNVIFEEEGEEFRSSYVQYRWERLSGGAWFIVTFLSGMDYEGSRAPRIQNERVVLQRIRSAFARIDEKHQLRSNGSQTETLAGLRAVRTNVAGKVKGEDAIGHLYLLSAGKHWVEIVALATESNRSVLKICRESVNTLSRVPAKKR